MSGGEFNYKQYNIIDIADEIELILNNQGKDILRDERYGNDEYYELYPEEAKYPEYSERVQDMFRLAILNLHTAFTFAHRIDWFLSGDDGEDSFLNRLNDDLDEVIRKYGEHCGYSIIEGKEGERND